jgi:hypothetical protein
MSIEAVVAYLAQADGQRDGASLVEDAVRAGFEFTAADLATCLEVREWLGRAQHDTELRAELLGARHPLSALADAARRAGYALEPDAIAAVLRAARGGPGELAPDVLDRVVGGLRWRPETGDEVLVAFLHGDTRAPFVLGSLWNGKDKPPTGR